MNNEKKKRKLKWQIKLFLYVSLIVLYSFIIGPKGIFIKDYIIKSNKISDDMHGIKILQFSDLHYGSTVSNNTVENLINNINKSKPDIVIFTGDLIDENYKLSKNNKIKIIDNLSKIKSTYGKYYIDGEEDGDLSDDILNNAGFINIDSSEKIIYLKNSSKILLTGPNSENICKYDEIKPNIKIVALHNPDSINYITDCSFDIAFAGHTHNGQINIYKLKDLLIHSKYKKTYQRVKNTRLYVNPGIGTSKIKVRLFNHPTINLYRFEKA